MPNCPFSPASEAVADFIFRYSASAPLDLFELTRTECINFINNDYAIVHLPLEEVSPIRISRDSYPAIPKLYGLLDNTALESSGIASAITMPSLRADGHGVLIGIIDTGIDYTNPLFRRADGTTRILSLWDQSIESEALPDPILNFQPFYGTVYDQAAIDRALRLETPAQIVPSKDENGHGTFLAGVAAGSAISQPFSYSGAAPEAMLAVVKLKPAKQYLRDFFLISSDVPAYQENDLMTAIRFLTVTAAQALMPLVILIGLGTNQGSHDGTSPLSLLLSDLRSVNGLAFVTGAGNEAGYHHHFLGNASENLSYEDVELRVAEGERGFCMELWAEESDLYTVGFVSPSGEVIERIPLALGTETTLPFRLDSSVITLTYQINESGSGTQLIFLRFQTPAAGIWHIRVYPSLAISGEFHLWLPMRGFLSEDTIFLRPNPDTTLTDPGNGAALITTAAYNHGNNSIYIHSSRGFTRLFDLQPTLAAPGVDIQGPLVSGGTENAASAPAQFTRRTGSSISAAITAGAVAGLFSWGIVDGNEPTLNSNTVRTFLLRGAKRNPAFQYPNREWGYGTLDLYQSFLDLRESFSASSAI